MKQSGVKVSAPAVPVPCPGAGQSFAQPVSGQGEIKHFCEPQTGAAQNMPPDSWRSMKACRRNTPVALIFIINDSDTL